MLSHIARIKSWHYSLPVASGVLLVISQPPVSLFFLAYIAIIPLLLTLEKGRARKNFMAGFVAGIVCYTGLVYWVVVAMNTYGGIGIPLSLLTLFLLVLYLSLYTGCFTWAISYLDSRFAIPFYLSAPAIWVLLEYLRGILLSGFPWSFLAHSQYNFLPIVQIVSITGSYFLSYLIVAANCLIHFVVTRKRFPLAYGGGLVLLFAVSLAFGFYQLRSPILGTMTASIVQGNILQDIKFDEAHRNHIITTYSRLTLHDSRRADLVIWPETAMPFVFLNHPSNVSVRGLPVSLSNHLLLGTISRDGLNRYYNTAYVIGKQGEIAGSYSKNHLVPFGEYTPLRHYFPFLANISVASGDFFSGPSHDPLVTAIGKIGMLICYEGVFPYITNDTVRRGAEVLVNITNDAWFGRTSAPYQHFSFYVFRAVETDRYVLRAANTGISSIIDPRGRTTAHTSIFRQDVLTDRFSLRQGETLYVRYGDYFVLLTLIFLGVVTGRAMLSVWSRPG
jgi:apolipoprotein N-acyltransferase